MCHSPTTQKDLPIPRTAMTPRNDSPVTRILLLSCSVLLVAAAVMAVALMRASRPRLVSINDLSGEDRQRLVEEFFEVSTRAYTPAWFEPGIRYTLRQNSEISVYGSVFRSNALGYRSGPVEKAPGVFRVVFVGDSWTYGMGVDAEESFPFQFERLANQALAGLTTVEAWSLALPAYNTMNEVTALEVFLDRLDPDAVVLCPTSNDNDSSPTVVPVGAMKRLVGRSQDLFGWDHSVVYKLRFVNSPGYMARWRKAFSEMKRTERYLKDLDTPFVLFFVARWNETFVHHMVRESGIDAPYVVTPEDLTQGDWRGPPPWYHGTPKCYEVFARIIQRLLATELGWPKVEESSDFLAVASYRQPPLEDSLEPLDELLRTRSESQLNVDYEPKKGRIRACVGQMDCMTGVMGRAATFVFKRSPGASRVLIKLERAPGDTLKLYPQRISATIVTSRADSETSIVMAGTGDHGSMLELPIPESARVGDGFDIEVRAERAAVGEGDHVLRSATILRIWQAR